MIKNPPSASELRQKYGVQGIVTAEQDLGIASSGHSRDGQEKHDGTAGLRRARRPLSQAAVAEGLMDWIVATASLYVVVFAALVYTSRGESKDSEWGRALLQMSQYVCPVRSGVNQPLISIAGTDHIPNRIQRDCCSLPTHTRTCQTRKRRPRPDHRTSPTQPDSLQHLHRKYQLEIVPHHHSCVDMPMGPVTAWWSSELAYHLNRAAYNEAAQQLHVFGLRFAFHESRRRLYLVQPGGSNQCSFHFGVDFVLG